MLPQRCNAFEEIQKAFCDLSLSLCASKSQELEATRDLVYKGMLISYSKS